MVFSVQIASGDVREPMLALVAVTVFEYE
jgi:hypothetical protein